MWEQKYNLQNVQIAGYYSGYIEQVDLLKQYPQIEQIIQQLGPGFAGLGQQFSQ